MDDDTAQAVCERYQAGHTLAEIREALGLSYHAVRKPIVEAGIMRSRQSRVEREPLGDAHVLPEFPDLKRDGGSLADFTHKLTVYQEAINNRDIRQETATVSIPDEKPVGIGMWADLHVGNRHTDHDLILRHAAIVRDTPGLYVTGLGDWHDNYIDGKKTGRAEAIMAPEDQQQWVYDLCREYLVGKMVVLEKGCHEQWTFGTAMTDPVKFLSRQFDVPYLGHGGRLIVDVGKEPYSLDLRHKGKGSSMFHPFHSELRSWREKGPPDVICHAHTHESGHIKVYFQEKWCLGVKPGCYKRTDDFTQRGDWQSPIASAPIVVLYPGEHRTEVYEDFEHGAWVLSRLRGGGTT